jgi:hypothetical protein
LHENRRGRSRVAIARISVEFYGKKRESRLRATAHLGNANIFHAHPIVKLKR